MKLLIKLVWKDFKRNKSITTALTVFLFLSALLMAGGLRVTGTIISSLNSFNEVAIPPEYLQMHKGDFADEELEDFIKKHDYIEKSLVVKQLNIRNANIVYKGETLERCLMDNGFVVQNEGFDLLLNMDNEIARVKVGEVGVPVYYAEELGIKKGDVITIHEGNFRKDLVVSTLIRDASMNAALTSSKRFLVSRMDLEEINSHMGEWEYSIEFLLKDGTAAAKLERDYMEAGMPSNGVAVTGKLLSIMNNISYGLVAAIIIAISILLIIIAVLCLSYIIRATMAEENFAVGEMKAIGIPKKEIINLYQMKYVILSLLAGALGFMTSVPFGNFFASSVIMYCGYGTAEWMKWVYPMLGILLLCLFVMLGCRRIIKRNIKTTVVELMRGEENTKKEGHYILPDVLKNRNLTIALGELKCKWKEYTVIFFVFVFSSFLILLPMNVKNTIENPSFITYMGVGESDIRIDIQYSNKLKEQKDAVESYMKKDNEIKKYVLYKTGYVQFENSDGQWEYMRVQSGDESVFPLEYLEGSSPQNMNEMAISYLQSLESGKKVGDKMNVVYDGKELAFNISGIYQDITYGGKTAKADIAFDENDVEVYIVYLDVEHGVSIDKKTDELRGILQDSKVTPIREFVSQTLGGIVSNMMLVEGAAAAISFLLIMLITVMILKLITAREHSTIAVKKAIGFSSQDIRIQLGIRILAIQFAAIIAGTILANNLGEAVFGLMLSSMGASKITMLVEPIWAYVICPAVQIVIVLITVVVSTKVVKNYHIRDQIVE
ncbi:FtsX-like permease family protein [Sedimentibacter sp. B4]|uniref:FtsX-like permease family protein n=1 Tax=Sedimentibacter sp. B4 TaxID=304766 RepID=UPI0002D9E95D|nr:ABC transporter permease [Sedimentibacter sp. B4]